MTVLAKMNGMVVRVNGDDHNPPHFHVHHADFKAMVRIRDLGLHKGKLPTPFFDIVTEWAEPNRDKLIATWNALNPSKPY